jgi:hypothetical protein
VEYLYGLITAAIEASALRAGRERWDLLDELCDALMVASAHPGVKASKSIAVDGSTIQTWGRSYNREVVDEDGEVKKVLVSSDPDAKWRGASADSWKLPAYGYELTGAVSVPEVGGDDVPLALLSMRFRPLATDGRIAALEVIGSVAKHQGSLGDVLVDREYTQSKDGKDFILPVRSLGGEPIIDLKLNQLGQTGTQHGAIIIDGQPFSPSLPSSLYSIPVPGIGAPEQLRVEYQAKIAARSVYAMVRHGSRKPDGSQVFQCPAAAGHVLCPLRQPSRPVRRGTLPVYNSPALAPGGVCSKQFTTFQASELPHGQRELYGSLAWFFSYHRRSRVEGIFGNAKNEATENLRRGSIRLVGLFKTGLLVAMAFASTNLRLGERWDERKVETKPSKRGRPPKRLLLEYAQVMATASRANAPPLAS